MSTQNFEKAVDKVTEWIEDLCPLSENAKEKGFVRVLAFGGRRGVTRYDVLKETSLMITTSVHMEEHNKKIQAEFDIVVNQTKLVDVYFKNYQDLLKINKEASQKRVNKIVLDAVVRYLQNEIIKNDPAIELFGKAIVGDRVSFDRKCLEVILRS